MTNDLKKTFDSLGQTFLISTLEKFGFRKTFIDRVKIFLNELKLCVINERITTKYLNLKKVRNKDTRSFYTFFRDTFYVDKK